MYEGEKEKKEAPRVTEEIRKRISITGLEGMQQQKRRKQDTKTITRRREEYR